jgi:hypothetical protein
LEADILNSLGKFGDNPRYARIIQEHSATLKWIEEPYLTGGPGFVDWCLNDEGLFWISGKPGAGKSTLMKFIHDHEHTVKIMSSAQLQRCVIISFFFHELGIPSEKTFSGLLHALLSQLLTEVPELITNIQSRFLNLQKRSKGLPANQSMWSEEELQRAFWDILQGRDAEVTILCMVDGLDECEPGSLHELLQFLLKLSAPSGESRLRFKILCSGRPENSLEIAFSNHPVLMVQEYTSEDISKFVTESFEAVTSKLHPNDGAIQISHSLITEIVTKAGGVFIWARLVVCELILAIEAGDTDKLDQKLKQLPSDLENLYSRIVAKIPRSIRHHTFNYLRLLLPHDNLPPGPGTLLAMALAIQPMHEVLKPEYVEICEKDAISMCLKTKRVLRDRCRGLINLPSLDSRLSESEMLKYFCLGGVWLHKTVQEYLFTDNMIEELCTGIDASLLRSDYEQRAAFYFYLLKVDPNPRLKALSKPKTQNETGLDLWELSDGEFDDRENDSEFIKENSKSNILEAVFRQLMECLNFSEFQSTTPLAPTWLPKIEALLGRIMDSNEAFYDAIIVPNFISFERFGEDPSVTPSHSDLLSLAIFFELYSYVRGKLETEEKVQKKGRPLLHYFLDSSFSREGSLDMVRFLCSKGCHPNDEFNSRTTWEYYLINFYNHRAVWAGWRYDDVLILLLDYGADPNQSVNLRDYQCCALHIMLSKHTLPYERLKTVLEEMLRLDARVDAKDSRGCSNIQLAEKNWPQAVDLLRAHSKGKRQVV